MRVTEMAKQRRHRRRAGGLRWNVLAGRAGGLLLLAGVIFCPAPAAAGAMTVTPLLGYTFGGDFEQRDTGAAVDLAEGASHGILLNWRDGNRRGAFYELLYHRHETSLNGDGGALAADLDLDLESHYLHFGGTYGKEGGRINPYVAAGLGLTHLDPAQGDAKTRFSFSLGAGVRVPLSARVGLRLEGRGFATYFNDRSAIFCGNNGCLVELRGDLMWQFTVFSGVSLAF
ncbi:MAG: outer membrane beta-barrel protein [Pelovirga sp.]